VGVVCLSLLAWERAELKFGHNSGLRRADTVDILFLGAGELLTG